MNMKVPHTTDDWRTSSFSAEQTDCVEMRRDLGALRDSKSPEAGALLAHVPALLAAVKADRLTR